MDPIFLTFLTIAANTLITYFLLSRQEDRYTKSLEEFRAKLQDESFERHAKFKDIHTKRVKVLEEYYRWFSDLVGTLNDLINDVIFSQKKRITLDPEAFEKRNNEVKEKISSAWDYIETNRLYIPRNVHNELSHLQIKIVTAQHYTNILFLEYKSTDQVPQNLIDEISKQLEVRAQDPETLVHPADVLGIIFIAVAVQKRRLESIYKSIADTEE
jgi:hypothetical protein